MSQRLFIKAVRPDFTTRGGFRWPFPGQTFSDVSPPDDDRVWVASTLAGASLGGHGLGTLLIVGVNESAYVDTGGGKAEVCWSMADGRVFTVVDFHRHLHKHGARANLTGADLPRANLTRADLPRANLTGADLTGANLTRAHLTGANLTRANLTRADLTRADLYGANLTRADLYGADLTRAHLTGASYSSGTVWPEGFDPTKTGAVFR